VEFGIHFDAEGRGTTLILNNPIETIRHLPALQDGEKLYS